MAYRRAEGVLSEILEGRAMLVAPDGTELITLNATRTAVWDALPPQIADAPRSTGRWSRSGPDPPKSDPGRPSTSTIEEPMDHEAVTTVYEPPCIEERTPIGLPLVGALSVVD